MNKIIKEMLVGNLLGDASIKRTLSGKSYVTFERSYFDNCVEVSFAANLLFFLYKSGLCNSPSLLLLFSNRRGQLFYP